MSNSDLERDKTVTRAVHHLFWRGMFHTPRYFIPTIIFYPPAFFIMNVLVPLEVAYGIAAVISRNYGAVGHYAITVLWLAIIGQAVYALATWTFNVNGIFGGTFVQRQVFANYLNKDYEFFGSNFVGALGAQASRIRDAFTDYNRLALFEIPRNAVIILASLAVLAVKSLPLALVAVTCMIFVMITTILFASYRLKYRRLVSQASSRIAGVLGDALSHGTAVKSFANEDYEQQRLKPSLRDWERAQLKSWNLFIPGNAMRNLLMAGTMAILLVVSAHLYREGKISIAIVALVQLYVARLINVTIDTAEMIKQYELIMGASYEAVATTLVASEIQDAPHTKKIGPNKAHMLKFDNVTYRYPEAAKNTHAVKDFSLLVARGEKIGLVGYSGGGKTTVTKLLLRFMDVNNGSIGVDGVDIRNLKQAELREAIAYVPQDPLLFHRSIRENIAYAKPEASRKRHR